MSNSSQATNCTVVVDNTETRIVKTTFYCIVLFTSLVANTLVVLIIQRKKRMRTTTNYFIANMAVSDLLFPIFAIPKEISEVFLGRMSWAVGGIPGDVLCKLISFLQDISTAVSIQSLVVIAVDRFYAVKFPLRPPVITPKKSRGIVCLTWLVALTLHCPYFYTFRVLSVGDSTLCVSTWEPAFETVSTQRLYAVILMVSLTLLPVALLVIFYALIATELLCKQIPGSQTNQERQRREKENAKVLKQVVTVVALFICCIMPFTVLTFLALFVFQCGFPPTYLFATKFIVHSNAALNPFIYFIFNDNYRRGFKEMFSARRRASHTSNSRRRTEVENRHFKKNSKRIQEL